VFKFNVNDAIYYMHSNKVICSRVVARLRVDFDKWISPQIDDDTWSPFGDSRIEYATRDQHLVEESNAYGSKEELLAAL
jgi:hypothetical protein